MRQEIYEIVLASVNAINNSLDDKLPVILGEKCPLYSGSAALDSISLVSLIVSIEESIEEKYSLPIILANEKAMSQRNSPFLTIGTLTDYTLALVKEGKNV